MQCWKCDDSSVDCTCQNPSTRKLGSHGKLDKRSRGKVSDQIDVEDPKENDRVVGGIFEPVDMFPKVIMPLRWKEMSSMQCDSGRAGTNRRGRIYIECSPEPG